MDYHYHHKNYIKLPFTVLLYLNILYIYIYVLNFKVIKTWIFNYGLLMVIWILWYVMNLMYHFLKEIKKYNYYKNQ